MKKIILCSFIFCSLAVGTKAQTTGQKNKAPVQQKIDPARQSGHQKNEGVQPGTTYSLTSSRGYPAYADSLSGRLRIADPTIRAFNTGANNPDFRTGNMGILGVPKLTYGVGNGRIIFRNSGATTFGTSTGSGSVGTGSFPGSVGTSGIVPGVNGKSPDAGPGLYGIPAPNATRSGSTRNPAAPARPVINKE